MKQILSITIAFAFVFTLIQTDAAAVDLDGKNPKKAIKVTPPSPKFTDDERHSELASRRKNIADEMENNSVLIMFSAEPKKYTNDVDFYYRQENNLYYLTALKQNGTSLVIIKNGDSVHEILFVPKRVPQAEHWNGRMYSRDDATRLSGLKTILDASELESFVLALKNKSIYKSLNSDFSTKGMIEDVFESAEKFRAGLYLLETNADSNNKEYRKEAEFVSFWNKNMFGGNANNGYILRNATPIFAKLRLVKSPYEIKILQHAIDITTEGLMRSMGMAERASYEYEVQAELEYTFKRRNANYWGFPSIVGCGPNANTLHYVTSQGEVKKGDLLLMDVGAEYDFYTADITRTFPVSGKFTKEQAEIYQIVYDAQNAAAAELKPGSSFRAASAAARAKVAERLFKLGLITKNDPRQASIWFTHGWGHWLGMNVHDVGRYDTTLAEGMVTTNEPGIYMREEVFDNLPDTPEFKEFRAKVRPVFEKYKNIGVRLEDDMLITSDGVEWMTKDLPRTISEVEAFMAKAKEEMKNYAGHSKPFDAVYAIKDFNIDDLRLDNNYDVRLGNSDGRTIRGGWVNESKTREIHSH